MQLKFIAAQYFLKTIKTRNYLNKPIHSLANSRICTHIFFLLNSRSRRRNKVEEVKQMFIYALISTSTNQFTTIQLQSYWERNSRQRLLTISCFEYLLICTTLCRIMSLQKHNFGLYRLEEKVQSCTAQGLQSRM